MSVRLLGRWNSDLAVNINIQQTVNSRNNPFENDITINLQTVLNGRSIKDICLGVYHMIILTDQDEILLAGTSLPIDDRTNLQLVQSSSKGSNIYFPIYKFSPSFEYAQTIFQSPLIACGPEFGIFTRSIWDGKNRRHFLNLFGWDSKKVFDSRRNTTRNSLSDILHGLLLGRILTEEIPTHDGELISQIVCGGDYWLLVMDKKKLFGKGYNRDGVLGLGHKKDVRKITILPAQEMLLDEADTIEKVCCGLHHAMYVISNPNSKSIKIFSSGDNRFGQIAQPLAENIKFQTKFTKSDSLTNLIQSNGFKDINCEYQSTWLLTLNNRLFACGFLANSSTVNISPDVQKVFVPIEFKIPYSSSLFSNCISPKATFHFGCGGFHSVFGNHRDDSAVGIGANTCQQLSHSREVVGVDEMHGGKIEQDLKYVNKLASIFLERKANIHNAELYVKKIVCSRDCSMLVLGSLPPIQGLGKHLVNTNLSDVLIVYGRDTDENDS